MDKVQKHNSFNTNTPSSESYRNELFRLRKKDVSKNYVYRLYQYNNLQIFLHIYLHLLTAFLALCVRLSSDRSDVQPSEHICL
jgi:hypothetical protein